MFECHFWLFYYKSLLTENITGKVPTNSFVTSQSILRGRMGLYTPHRQVVILCIYNPTNFRGRVAWKGGCYKLVDLLNEFSISENLKGKLNLLRERGGDWRCFSRLLRLN